MKNTRKRAYQKTWVVKIGTRALVSKAPRFESIATQIHALRQLGIQVILVSSGAVHLGCQKLGIAKRPTQIKRLQAAAAAGQTALMLAYESALARYALPVGQVLLTHADLADKKRYANARATLETLLSLGAVPIINENDTVSVKELTFGDNDQLASVLASVMGADALVLLTDVIGVQDAAGKRLERITHTHEALRVARAPSDEERATSLGGMQSKIYAAARAAERGIATWIADARQPDTLIAIAQGREIGTYFAPAQHALSARKHWIGHVLRPAGFVLIDDGAAHALVRRGGSLLPAGIIGVAGNFETGDAVAIRHGDRVVGQGLSRYSVASVARLAGAKTDEISARLGYAASEEVIHRDDLVIFF